jgi:ribosomal protein L16 Arg81 hydroxylase
LNDPRQTDSARLTANAYISFGDMSGFGVHNDDHDVLVVQIDGRKKWRFFKSEINSEKATVN